jgi:hypothetical protein
MAAEINDMEKTVTKEEVERVLQSKLPSKYYSEMESILNELFPPEFKAGDYLTPIETNGTLSANTGDICIVDSIDAKYVYVEWITSVRKVKVGYGRFNFRHSTPEEIAADEWEEGKGYKVWFGEIEAVRVASSEVGRFYPNGEFKGKTLKGDKYEKL